MIVGLAIARFADGMKGERVAKSLIFIPAAISLAGAGIVWKFVYAGPPFEVGLLNQVTKAIPGLPTSLGGDGDKLWLVDRNIGALAPPASAPGLNTFLLIVIFIWAVVRVGDGRLLGRDQGRPRVADRGRQGRRGDQSAGVLQGDAAVHQGHRRHRRDDHRDRRPQGVRHRRLHDRRQLRHQHDRQRVLPDLLRAEPQRLRVGVRGAAVPARHTRRRGRTGGHRSAQGRCWA